MKTFLFLCLVAIIIIVLYYLVKSLVFGGLLAVIGIGFNFLVSKKLKDRLDQ